MRIIARKTLRKFWERPNRRDAEQPLKAWFREAERADWANSAQLKADFRTASIVANDRVVFNIAGNKYRLVVHVHWAFRIMYIRFIGTHREYDAIDVTEV
jgi:mRNA interferase HigB